MRKLLIACFLFSLGASSLAACSGKGDASPDATATPEDFFKHRGQVTPLHEAIGGVAFRPFIPARIIIETALLPPYNGGDDTRQNRGIAFEYMSRGEAFALEQWPGASMPGPRDLGTIDDCDITAYDMNGGVGGRQGALWSNGRVVSNLVAAGNASNKAVFDEAKRLVRAGACR